MDPANIYQLALRLGVSFAAASWALVAHDLVPKELARSLQDHTVKELKLALATARLIENPWADVWKLTQGDSGTTIEAGPDDVFAVHLEENSSAGYLWQLLDAGSRATVVEERVGEVKAYGAAADRIVFLRFDSPGMHRLVFAQRRPWNKQTLSHIDISIDNHGKEVVGVPRRFRERALELTVGA